STASKPKGSNTSTASGAPTRSTQITAPGRTLPNTGAKSRKRTQEVSEDVNVSKKQKPTTVTESRPASSVETTPTEAAPSGDGQRDKEKTIAETSEASPKKQSPKKDKKKKKKEDK
ncbi:hypothetical protein A2U01_0047020, partial [Trifolium medium]|nr:hypothetical protein [Trifolium medium]